MKIRKLLGTTVMGFIALVAIAALAACSSESTSSPPVAASPQTVPVVPTATVQPTAIPQPTATAIPVATPTVQPTATPEPIVEVIKDIDYNAAVLPNAFDRLDLFLPKSQKDFPVVMLIHGGGMWIGAKEDLEEPARYFASQGFGSVSINYRLSDSGYKHPAHVRDTARAFAWIHENIESYGGNPNQIFVVGGYAGAYLAALLASDGKYLAEHGLSTTDIRGIVPIRGQFRIDQMDTELDGEITFPGRRDETWDTDEEGWVAASPNTYLSADTLPALFLYGDADLEGYSEMSEEIAAELRDAGQPNSVAREVANRYQYAIYSQLGKPDDEAAELILNFMKDNL